MRKNILKSFEIPSMRDTLTPVENREIELHLEKYDTQVQKMTWQVFTLDGEKCLQQETLKEIVDGGIKIKVNDSNKDKLDSIQDVLQQYVQKMQDDDKADQDDVKSLADQLGKLSDFNDSNIECYLKIIWLFLLTSMF